jgi:predicted GNAT family acetyltransferase
MQVSVQHDPERTRFHVPPESIDGDVQHKMANMGIVLNYRRKGPQVVDFHSTLVPPHLRGRGIGTALVQHALDWARAENQRVVPTCPFVQDFLERHPEYQDLIADEPGAGAVDPDPWLAPTPATNLGQPRS